MSEESTNEAVSHWESTMEDLPAPMEVLRKIDPTALEAYTQWRQWVLTSRSDGLDRKTKHLIFSILDVAAGNKEGAINHGRAARRNGLESKAYLEALVLTFMTVGIATWGGTGYHVIQEVYPEVFSD
jgi:alkylhydroperoxidase/carboxymuconolactone decarboxylase family protein YurZ